MQQSSSTVVNVANHHHAVTMSSREIAELTGKRHPDVKRDIEGMLEQLSEDASSFAHIYFDTMEVPMIVYAADFHPNGFFINAPKQDDFWVHLSPLVGWGKFSMLHETNEFTKPSALFQLVEVLPAGSEPPELVVGGSNVLWRLPEALEVWKSTHSYGLEGLRPLLWPRGQRWCQLGGE